MTMSVKQTDEDLPKNVQTAHDVLDTILIKEMNGDDHELVMEFVAWIHDNDIYVPHEAFNSGHVLGLHVLRPEVSDTVLDWVEEEYPEYSPEA